MSRRTQIEEEFDDDTDLPLPSAPLPNTGTSGPLLQEIDISDDEIDPSSRAGPASPSRPARGGPTEPPELKNTVTDITPYKAWTCIYPIYLDAKRPYGTGERRVKREKALWWPLSKDIADAANRLGLGVLHEVTKSHPRDWENPGRVRVLWKKDGRLVNPVIKTKKMLLEMISIQIQHLKPETVPKPPYTYSATSNDGTDAAPPPAPSAKSAKGKQTLLSKSKSPSVPSQSQKDVEAKRHGRPLPVPPSPLVPLASRVSPYSPALSSGVLMEAVKAGMNAQEGVPAAPVQGFSLIKLEKLQLSRYNHGASLALLVCDYIITFPDEASLVWSKPRLGVASVLFFLNRYLAFVDLSMSLYGYAAFGLDSSRYKVLDQTSGAMFTFGIVISEFLIALRVWVLWGRTRGITLGLAALFTASIAIFLSGYFWKKGWQDFQYIPLNVLDLPGFYTEGGGQLGIVNYVVLLLVEIIILTLTIIECIKRCVNLPVLSIARVDVFTLLTPKTLIDLFIRDGLIYFVALTATSAINVTMIIVDGDAGIDYVLWSLPCGLLSPNIDRAAAGPSFLPHSTLMPRLPPELLSIIVELLAVPDKLNFSLTCKYLRSAAIPSLFYSVRNPGDVNEEDLRNISQAVKRAARKIRVMQTRNFALDVSHDVRRRMYDHLASAFPLITSLSSEIDDDYSADHTLHMLQAMCTSFRDIPLEHVYLDLASLSTADTPFEFDAIDYPSFPALKTFHAVCYIIDGGARDYTARYIQSLLSKSTLTLVTLSLQIELEDHDEARHVSQIIDAFPNLSNLSMFGSSLLLYSAHMVSLPLMFLVVFSY
ncbi:hypothetical protein ONZ45_g8432 [Pleurotus djamor]|nr:hypothetical protein ONZ45_g8432 [Pleurotus djamor]